MPRLLLTIFVILVPGLTFAQSTATNAEGGATADATPPATPPQVVDAPMTLEGQLADGHRLYRSGDYQGALSAYEEAKKKAPGKSIIYYFIGAAQAKLGRHDDAVVTLRTAGTIAKEKDVQTRAKTLFATAVVEESRNRADAAVEAWKAYKGYAQTNKGIKTFVATAEARLEAWENKRKLDEQYKVVRQRIASSE